MARKRHHYRRRTGNNYEIDVTTFLNLMVVLVPFLLITAVFSRLTIVELNLPSTAGGPVSNADSFRVEVIVREQGVEISNGSAIIATIPKKEDEFDLETLSNMMVALKQEYPQQDSASVLMEPQIPYDYLIQVMDTVRSVAVPTDTADPSIGVSDPNSIGVSDPVVAADDTEPPVEYYALFTEISVGEAP